MIQAVWKYNLETLPGRIQHLVVPQASQFLSFGKDLNGHFCVWYLVTVQHGEAASDTSKGEDFLLMWTGQEMPEGEWKFIDTLTDNAFVWHAFRKVT